MCSVSDKTTNFEKFEKSRRKGPVLCYNKYDTTKRAANATAEEEASGISEHYVRSVFQPLWHKKCERVAKASERVADLGIIACTGAEELTPKINQHLLRRAREADIQDETFIIDSECPRFSSGDGKGLIKASIRGDDLFFIVDVGNYSCTYKYFRPREPHVPGRPFPGPEAA